MTRQLALIPTMSPSPTRPRRIPSGKLIDHPHDRDVRALLLALDQYDINVQEDRT